LCFSTRAHIRLLNSTAVRRSGPTWSLISRTPRHVAHRLHLTADLEVGESQCRLRQPCLWRRHQTQIAPIAPRKWYMKMWRSGERYSEGRRHLELVTTRPGGIRGLSAAVPDERVVRRWPTQRKTRVAWRSKAPFKKFLGRTQDFQATPPSCHLTLKTRPICICLHALHFAISPLTLSGLTSFFYLEVDLPMLRLSSAAILLASPISHHILG
jgi:hypothetical protein